MSKARRTLERIRNVPGLGGDVTSVAVLVVIALVCGGYIFSQYGFISPTQHRLVFSAEFAKAPGVRPASRQEVRIAGVEVGRITGASVAPDGNAKLTMSLDPGHQVYSNARVLLRTKAPLNIMYVALDPGGPPARPLADNAVIPVTQTERPIQPFEVLGTLDSATQDALTSLLNESDAALVDAPDTLPAGLDETSRAMGTFKPVLDQLATRRRTIAGLVTALSQISQAVGHNDTRLANLADSLHTTLGVVASHDNDVKSALAQVPGLSRSLNSAMTGVSRLTTQLNPTLDSLNAASGELPQALRKLTSTVRSAGQLVSAATAVVAKARPVVADLRPLVTHLNTSLGNLRPTAHLLPSATQRIVPWLEDLSAFVYQTSSAFSLADANGGWGRALLTLDVTNPAGGLKPQPDTRK